MRGQSTRRPLQHEATTRGNRPICHSAGGAGRAPSTLALGDPAPKIFTFLNEFSYLHLIPRLTFDLTADRVAVVALVRMDACGIGSERGFWSVRPPRDRPIA